MRQNPRFRVWTSFAVAIALGGLMSASGLGNGAAGAIPSHPTLSGVATCDRTTGSEVVTWSVHNQFRLTQTVTVVTWSPASTVAPLALTLGPKVHGTIIQTLPGVATSASLTIRQFIQGVQN